MFTSIVNTSAILDKNVHNLCIDWGGLLESVNQQYTWNTVGNSQIISVKLTRLLFL